MEERKKGKKKRKSGEKKTDHVIANKKRVTSLVKRCSGSFFFIGDVKSRQSIPIKLIKDNYYMK
jgi:hypothetical protein